MEDFNRAIRLDPAYARAYFNRGKARICLQDFRRGPWLILTGPLNSIRSMRQPT